MARGNAELIIRIITDAKDATKGIAEASKGFDGFNSTMASLAAPAGIALGAITALGTAAVGSASELQQSAGSVEAVFGSSAAQIQAWGKQAADSVGLAQSEYQNFASVIGAQLKNLGVPMSDVAGNTNDLITLGADLAATYGGSTQQAVEALSSALRGEADPAEKYGLALNQTAVNAYLAEQGLTGLTGEALTAAKAQAVMALATEQAGGAIGQFGRESDTVAGQQQRLNAQWENAMAALGEGLLPVITPVIEALADFAGWVAENISWIGPLIAIIGALAAAVVAYTAVQAVLNVVMTANPIGIIIVAIGLLIAAIIALGVWIANNTEQIKAFFGEIGNFFAGIWQAIVTGWNSVVAAFANGLAQIGAFFASIWAAIVAAWNAVVAAFSNGLNQIVAFFTSVWAAIAAAWNAVVAAFSNGLNQIGSFFRSVFTGISSFITSVFNSIRAVVASVVNFFVSAWQGAVSGVQGILRTLQNIFTSVFNAILAPINAVVGAFNAVIGAIKNVISWIGKIKIPDLGGLFKLGGTATRSAATPAVAGPAALSAFSGPSVGVLTARAAQTSGGVTINVNGGLDSADAIARRIQQLLRQRDQRAHGVTITRSLR